MSDWIDDTLTNRRDKHHKAFIGWIEGLIEQGYNEDEIGILLIEEWAGERFFMLYCLWLQEYFDDMKETV